ncbi:MAG: hypothetical protein FJW30_02385 [Acidobacteria bacterium]|nr:hypothetical protein [Acidobacteriota bacterium]
MNLTTTVRTALIAASGWVGAGLAYGAPILDVNIRPSAGSGTCIVPESQRAASGPITVGQNCSSTGFGFTRTGRASATADLGSVGASAAVELSAIGSLDNSAIAGARASGEYLFTGPVTSISAPIILDLSGGLSGGATGFGLGFASLFVSVAVDGFARGALLTQGPDGFEVRGNSLFPQTGPLSSFTNPQGHSLNFTTLPFTIPVGTPVTVELFVEARAGVLGNMTARAEFGNTLTFNGSGAVFGLPDGFTANGPSLVDNMWTGEPAAAVPEPASWSLCAATMGLAILLRRWNRA